MPHRQRNKYKVFKKKLMEKNPPRRDYYYVPSGTSRYVFEISGTDSTATISGGTTYATSSTTSVNV